MTLRNLGITTILIFSAGAVPAIAACAEQRLISTVRAGGIVRYVYTPGFCDEGYPCDPFSVSLELDGDFWSLGAGDPLVGAGIDDGAFPAFENAGGYYYTDGWLKSYAGYASYIYSGWASDFRIDGCPDPGGCMAIQFSDQVDNIGYFALLTAASDTQGDFYFDPGGPIVLAEIPRPFVVGMNRPDAMSVEATVAPMGSALDGIFADPACPEALIGSRIYSITIPNGALPPQDRNRAAGWQPETGVVPPDESAMVTGSCVGDQDIYLTRSLVFESGFETAFVSENAIRLECGPNFTEIDERPRPRPGSTLELRGRPGKRARRR